MILSVSRRTDIPCHYSEWFMNRIRAGYLYVRNPMNFAQLSRVELTPEIVDCIVFWTKDAAKLMPYLAELDSLGYKYYFQYTLTAYGSDIERKLRPKSEIEDNFIALSKLLGGNRERVIWRYDPIILNDDLTIDFHKREFKRLCEKLSSYTDMVTISFVDSYPRLRSEVIRQFSPEEIAELSEYIGRTAQEYSLRATACCEKYELGKYGIERSSCIDKKRIESVIGCELDIKQDRNQRSGCGCYESVDVGAYNSCPNNCVYCYANVVGSGGDENFSATMKRFSAHNPEGELQIGKVSFRDKPITRKVRSHKIICENKGLIY